MEKGKAVKMKKVSYMELTERYCYCPYCQSLESDESNQENIMIGDILECSNCGKKFEIE